MSVTFYNTKDPHISGLSASEDSTRINTDIIPGESQPLIKNSRRLVKANICSKFARLNASVSVSNTTPEKSADVKPEEDKKSKRKRWTSIYIMSFTVFLSALSKRCDNN